MKLIDSIKTIRQFRLFKKEISEEMENADSTFNKLNLRRNNLGDVIYVQLNYDDEKFMASGYNVQEMVNKDIDKMNHYFDKEIRWGEFLELKVAQFYSEDGFPTYSYAVEYHFTEFMNSVFYLLKAFLIAVASCASIWGIIKGFLIIYNSTV